MAQPGYREWWKVAKCLDEAQRSSVTAMLYGADDLAQDFQDKLREALKVLLDILSAKGFLPGAHLPVEAHPPVVQSEVSEASTEVVETEVSEASTEVVETEISEAAILEGTTGTIEVLVPPHPLDEEPVTSEEMV